jgi:GTPase
MKKLINELLRGDRRAAARLISIVENDRQKSRGIMHAVRGRSGGTRFVGVTGPPGSGKSTLINGMTAILRKRGRKVGVIAIDPTSPLSGGALLGDRIRMQDHAKDEGVFIRSMATRKGTGGLSPAAKDAMKILAALGMDTVFLETAGAGQSETAVRHAVRTVVVVVNPDTGDDIQMMKAGIMEIGDVFVVNKGDLPNAGTTARALESLVRLRRDNRSAPPVVVTEADGGKGLERLVEAVEQAAK